MLSLDWNKLAPHRPLDAGDMLYVPRPKHGGERLAQLIRAGLTPMVVAGPVGSGKSTELAAAAGLLANDPGMLTCLVHLDRQLNMRTVREDELLQVLTQEVAEGAKLRGLKLSSDLESKLEGPQRRLFQSSDLASQKLSSDLDSKLENARRSLPGGSGWDLLTLTLREVRARTRDGAVVLLIDGLEKTPEKIARELAPLLLDLREEAMLVIVVSPALVTGPRGYDVLNNARLFTIGAVPVHSESAACHFLWTIALRRLGLNGRDAEDEALQSIVELACLRSGGIPRTFLQLLQDAAGYARLADRTPTEEDLLAASMDQYDSLKRLLRDGDMIYLEKAANTEGLEIPVERRVRFLVHGLLLEYEVGNNVMVRPHPLLMMERTA